MRIQSLRWASQQVLLSSVIVWAGCGDEVTTLGTPANARHQGVAAPQPDVAPEAAPIDAPDPSNGTVPRASDLASLIEEKDPEPAAPTANVPTTDEATPSSAPAMSPAPTSNSSPTPGPAEPPDPAPGGVFGGGFGTPTPAPTTPAAGFGGGPTPANPAPAPAQSCSPLAANTSSGDIGTGAACFSVPAPLQGWQVSNLGSRTLTVNGQNATPPSLPPAEGGSYTFAFSAGEPSYTAFSTW